VGRKVMVKIGSYAVRVGGNGTLLTESFAFMSSVMTKNREFSLPKVKSADPQHLRRDRPHKVRQFQREKAVYHNWVAYTRRIEMMAEQPVDGKYIVSPMWNRLAKDSRVDKISALETIFNR